MIPSFFLSTPFRRAPADIMELIRTYRENNPQSITSTVNDIGNETFRCHSSWEVIEAFLLTMREYAESEPDYAEEIESATMEYLERSVLKEKRISENVLKSLLLLTVIFTAQHSVVGALYLTPLFFFKYENCFVVPFKKLVETIKFS